MTRYNHWLSFSITAILLGGSMLAGNATAQEAAVTEAPKVESPEEKTARIAAQKEKLKKMHEEKCVANAPNVEIPMRVSYDMRGDKGTETVLWTLPESYTYLSAVPGKAVPLLGFYVKFGSMEPICFDYLKQATGGEPGTREESINLMFEILPNDGAQKGAADKMKHNKDMLSRMRLEKSEMKDEFGYKMAVSKTESANTPSYHEVKRRLEGGEAPEKIPTETKYTIEIHAIPAGVIDDKEAYVNCTRREHTTAASEVFIQSESKSCGYSFNIGNVRTSVNFDYKKLKDLKQIRDSVLEFAQKYSKVIPAKQ